MEITGVTTSRLKELKKYKPTEEFGDRYHISTEISKNGVNYNDSVENDVIVYYINNIEYKDLYENNKYIITEFKHTLEPPPINLDNFLVHNENYGSSIETPKVKSDVFIDRHEKSPFKNNYLLSDMESLLDITTFAGGNYFNIIKE